MASLLCNAGYEITENEIADIYIINTCTVTNTGASRSRSAIRKCKQNNPSSIVAVTGCLVQTNAEEIAKIDGVDVVAGVKRGDIVELIEQLTENFVGANRVRPTTDAIISAGEHGSPLQAILSIPNKYEEISAVDTQSRVRAVIKIQDGCDNFCSYCIIPYARGRARSRKLENIITEARALAKNYTEVVITGINLSSYGNDLTDSDLSKKFGLIDVIERLNEINGIRRIRLGSLSPTVVTNEFVTRAKRLDKLCPQFHLSLQSGCDEILQKMNRKYDTAQYLSAVKLLRENIPNCAITTDLIVGFPGETDEQFEKSYEFCKKIEFSQMHIFKYSKRAGTVAGDMKNQVSKVDKQQRSEKMLELAAHMKTEFYQNYIGEIVDVLFETKKKSGFFGLTANYMDVLVKSNNDLEGKIKLVKIIKVDGENLVGEIIE